VDGMRVWDIRRAVQMIHFVRDADKAQVELEATGRMAVNSAHAALFEPGVRKTSWTHWPQTVELQPDYLNGTRYFDILESLGQGGFR
jgi:hypothetical protein